MKVKIEHVKLGDLIKNNRHPHAGIGIVVEIDACRPASQYIIAVWPEHGCEIAYADEIEIINEYR